MSDRSIASARKAVGELWLSMTLVQSRLLLGQLGALLIAIGGIFTWWDKYFEPFYGRHPALSVAIIAAFPLYIVCFSVGPQMWHRKRKNQREVIALTSKPEVSSARYFRLDPYVATSPQKFRREDDAHKDVLRWIRETSRPVLFLSGVSGSGKSSVLEAYVLPMLRAAGWCIEQVRTFGDPLPQLETILAAVRPQGTRLLVVFDQFEEFVILEDRASAEARRLFLARLQQLCRAPPPGPCLLLSFRRDYMSDVIAMKIDDLVPGQTFMEIDAFKRGPARRFLEGAPAAPTSDLVDRLLAGAEAIDDVPARFRPVTLNMLGLTLQDYDREVTDRPERLVQTYIEAAVSQPEIKEIAPRVIEKMITDANTKKPRTVTDLASETALSNEDVVACLVLLERKGLVRRLDGLWEISHDFVARQFASLPDRLRPNPWFKIGMFAAACLFVLLVGGAAIGVPMFVQQQAFAALRFLQITVTEDRDGKLRAKFPLDATDATVTSALPHLVTVGISNLDLTGSHMRLLPSLDKLTALTTLDLRGSWITTLPSLDTLTALATLNLGGSQVTTLPSLDKLTALKTLDVSFTPQLTTLPSLDKLRALKTLDLSYSQLATPPSLDNLTALTTLKLHGSSLLPSLDKLTALTTLDLFDSWVTTLPSLDKLTALTTLNLSYSHQLTTLPSLDKLTALTTLNLSHSEVRTLPSLDKLTALTTLDLGHSQLTTLPSLDRLTVLKELNLRGRPDLLDDSAVQQLTSRGVWVIRDIPEH